MNAAALAQIKQTLLSNPRRLDPRPAALRMLRERYKCTPAAAKQKLEEIRKTHAINDLFRSVMPEEYAIEIKKAGGSRIDVGRAFFPSLGFPVYEDHVLDQLNGETYWFSIPIPALSFHACPNCFNFETLPPAYQLAFLITRSTDASFGAGSDCDLATENDDEQRHWNHIAAKHKLPDRLRPRGVVDMEILFRKFAELKNPLRYLPDVIRGISYSTGSIFLDFDEEMGAPEIEWTAHNVKALREEYSLARQIEARIEKLEKWLRQNPKPRLSQGLRVYEKAKEETNARNRHAVRVRVGADEGLALVRIL